MGEENKNHSGLRLKSEDDGGNKSESSEAAGSNPTAPAMNYNGLDGEDLNLERYFQDADTFPPKSSIYATENDIRHKVDRPNWTFFLFAVIGILLIFVQLNTLQEMSQTKKIIKSGNSVLADVTDVNRIYRRRAADVYSVYVDYEVNGVQYSHIYLGDSRYYVSAMEKVLIYYDEKNPRKIASDFVKGEKTFRFWVGWSLVALIAFAAYRAYKNPDRVSKSMLSGLTKKRNRW